ncbi:MAG: DUF805 domain-containing protein [Selenomonadales bacterium]|nr:DUF805 domain-containing protein [Selenomonadales bacterium]
MKHSQKLTKLFSPLTMLCAVGGWLIISLIDGASAAANPLGWLNLDSDLWMPKPVEMPEPHPKFVGVPILLLMFFSLVFYMWRDRPIVKSIIDYFYRGRLDRTSFIISCAGLYFSCTILAFIYILTRTNIDPFMPVFSTLALAYEISLTVRRSHDVDLNWGPTIFLIVLTLIPGISFLPFFYLIMRTGSNEENRFGPSPKKLREAEIAELNAAEEKASRRLANGKMECYACHRVIDEDSVYCKYCGEKQDRTESA